MSNIELQSGSNVQDLDINIKHLNKAADIFTLLLIMHIFSSSEGSGADWNKLEHLMFKEVRTWWNFTNLNKILTNECALLKVQSQYFKRHLLRNRTQFLSIAHLAL